MSYTQTKGKTLNLNDHHRSNGSELIPAEVQANIRHDEAQSADTLLATSYTVDDEGLLNNYAIEPSISASEYPSQRQQRRYILLGTGAILFVVILMLISTAVS